VTAQAGSSELSVELGTGFADADVAVLVDGLEVWCRTGVTTDYSVGLADVVQVPLPAGGAPAVQVRVDGKTHTAAVSGPAAAEEIRIRCDLDPAGTMTTGPAPEGPIF